MTAELIDAGLDAHWTNTLSSTTGLPRPPFSPAVKVSGTLLFTSGQTYPVIGEADPAPPATVSLAEQTRACLINLERIVIAAGGHRRSIVAITIHNTKMADQGVVNSVYTEFFEDHRPVRTHVEVRRLADPDLLIEITAIAALPDLTSGVESGDG